MSCGIYKITNLLNNKSYIGQSTFIEKRWSEEKRNKNNGKTLTNAINKYGIENFKFEILEECEQDLLNEKEQQYINLYNSVENGYNMTYGGDGHRLYLDSETNRKEKRKQWYLKNKDYMKKWRENLPEKKKKEINEKAKKYVSEYRKNNKDLVNEQARKSYQKRKKDILQKRNNTLCLYESEIITLPKLRRILKKRYGSSKGANKFIISK